MILGRQPALGLVELESLYGAPAVQPMADGRVAQVAVDPCLLAFDRLGGSTKFCKLLTTLETTNWKQIEKFLVDVAPGHSERMPEGKMRLGLSTIGFDEVSLKRIEATGLNIKKAIRSRTGRSVRLVPNAAAELNAAQIIHNQLTGSNGWELYLVRDGRRTVVAQTVKVQDIESYTRRDRERPKRDAKVGMLPPKLAQIIINLAVGQLPEDTLQNICDTPADTPLPAVHYAGVYLLDPFCGTGVILQEASLMGYDVQGTDLDPRMVAYTKENLRWLLEQPENRISPSPGNPTDGYALVETGDATTHHWTRTPSVVASETYLGRPFTEKPSAEILNQTVSECNLIIKKFLQNVHGQLKPGTRLCIAVPAWQTGKNQFKHLPLIDRISDLGYNRVSFEHIRESELLYYREDQIVARELLVLQVN